MRLALILTLAVSSPVLATPIETWDPIYIVGGPDAAGAPGMPTITRSPASYALPDGSWSHAEGYLAEAVSTVRHPFGEDGLGSLFVYSVVDWAFWGTGGPVAVDFSVDVPQGIHPEDPWGFGYATLLEYRDGIAEYPTQVAILPTGPGTWMLPFDTTGDLYAIEVGVSVELGHGRAELLGVSTWEAPGGRVDPPAIPAVPEPGTLVLLALGVVGALWRRRGAAVLLVLLAGCSSTGQEKITQPQVVERIVPGKTSKADVLALLGQPAEVGFLNREAESWTFWFERSSYRVATFIPVVGIFAGGSDVQVDTLTILFSGAGVVEKIGRGAMKGGAGGLQDMGNPQPLASDEPPRPPENPPAPAYDAFNPRRSWGQK